MIEALRKKFPLIEGPHAQDICYATQNRQTAVKDVAHQADLLLVVGSENSSNSNRLVEVSTNLGTPSYLIDTADDIKPEWLNGKKNRGPHGRSIRAGNSGGAGGGVPEGQRLQYHPRS